MARVNDSELTLQREHAMRERQRAAMYGVVMVMAGLVLVAGLVLDRFVGAAPAPGAERGPMDEVRRALGQPLDWRIIGPAILLAGLVLLCVRVALQWDKAVVLRLGKFRGLAGPGMFLLAPFMDRVTRYVDMRIRATDFEAESTLTRDTVPVNVDAIVFWLVWDARKAVLEVESYYRAIVLSAQTALRDSIGRHTLAEMLTEREALGKALQEVLDKKTSPWGITVQSVEIRDVIIPPQLEDAMSKQAQAERERQARIILGTAETEIAAKFVDAALPYQDNPVAVHLRAMNMLYEGLRDKATIVVVPSSAADTMNLGAIGGLSVLAKHGAMEGGTPGAGLPGAGAVKAG